jgi:cell division protein FtsI/penicillin-binding protein 2
VRRLRANFVFGALLVLFGLVVGRLLKLQVVDAAEYRGLVSRQGRALTERPQRGDVLDRHGRVLAHSRPVRHAMAQAGFVRDPKDPSLASWVIRDVPRFAAAASDLLEGSPSAMDVRAKILLARASTDFARTNGYAMVTLRSNVDAARDASRLDEAALKGLVVRVGDRRDYPNGPWAGYLVGRAAGQSADSRLAGLLGVEAGLDRELSGTAAPARRVRVDGANHPFLERDPGDSEGAEGAEVRLSIDLVIQGYCEQALDRLMADWGPEGAVAIVLDPAQGDVLALATRPAYDPSDPRSSPKFDYSLQAAVEPGSTFKPFTVCRALTAGVVTPGLRFEMPVERLFAVGRATRRVRDAHDAGTLSESGGTVVELVAQSSNTGAAWLASLLGDGGMVRLLDDLGVESRYGLRGLAAGVEGRGRYAREDDKRPRGTTDHLGMGFGHGFTLTPLRLAASFAAFAREDFTPVVPRLVLSVGGDDVPASAPLPSICPDPVHRATVRRGLEAVVTEGTAAKTVLSDRFSIAGKTGTAKKPVGDGYYSCSFAGYAPAQAPRIVVLVMAIEPRKRKVDGAHPYGALIAGPYVRSIVERTLGEYMGLPDEAPRARGGAR